MIYYEKLSERIENEFLVDRYGKIHKVTAYLSEHEKYEDEPHKICSFHARIAQCLFPNSINASETIRKLGWIIIGQLGNKLPYCEKYPTQSQLNTMFDLGYKLIHSDSYKLFEFKKIYNE